MRRYPAIDYGRPGGDWTCYARVRHDREGRLVIEGLTWSRPPRLTVHGDRRRKALARRSSSGER